MRTRFSAKAIAITIRPYALRALAGFLLLISLIMIIISKSHEPAMGRIRMAVADVVIPVVNVLAKPLDAVQSAQDWVHETITLREENRSLKTELAQLHEWKGVANELQSENDKLRNLLKFAPANKSAYTSARVAVDIGSPYVRSAVITSGLEQGVQEDLAVINDRGLVGRVVEVGKRTSRVLLLTDVNSRIPVISENSRERTIAGGDGSDMINLLYMPEASKLQVGEKIITSGDGGVMPPGLPVGIVTKVEKDKATVKPFVDWYHLEYVSVVDFSM